MKTELEKLVLNVENWAYDRNLISDGIGDATVCLIILSKQLGFNFQNS